MQTLRISLPGRLPVVLALLSVYLIWGSTYLAIRITLESLPPFLMAGTRFVAAGAILMAFLLVRGARLPRAREWGNAALVGALLLVGGNGGVVVSQQWVGSGIAALGVSTVALWTALFAGLLGQWPRRGEWLGLVAGFGGVVLLNTGASLRATPQGALALLVATTTWAFGSMWSRRLCLPRGLMAPAAEMLSGGALFVIISAVRGENLPVAPTLRSGLALAYLIVFGSLLGFSAYMYLLDHVRPSLAISYAYVNPLVAMALGVGVAGERVTAIEWLAMVVILSGVALVVLARERRITVPYEAESGSAKS